ncbi:hypothetical protein GCM10020358_46640 [Amorphoplanes nipponensis]|uniref:CdiA C-terminal tRNase domain-containing protein n=1 Tax=Actinoplanes nipponensis TaxID=135950 RepID=A0A919JJF9_9ACTN|nr:WXG100 family type VII secretion target [Actinoplanes nipponensis]GIE52124.1 hypothetical protein Ani05nite_56580 [Actinoplanes nipponensis]
MTVNPLVASSIDEPSPWAGVWIAEDIDLVAQGVHNGSWLAGTLGLAGAGLDALALVSDPVGALLQYGIAWLIDHVRPLSEALDWLAGDPARIAAEAATWRNVAGSLTAEAEALAHAVEADLTEWSGAAATAYREWSGRRELTLRCLARAAETTATITAAAGTLIGTVRLLVRDAVATVVSRLIAYAGELIATAGLATPLVVEQVTSLCAAWGARIARWLRSLIASLRRLGEAVTRLGRDVDDLKGASPGKGAGTGEPVKRPEEPSRNEEERLRALGMDPAVGKLRPEEVETAQRVEQALGIELRRSEDPNVDWVDAEGKTYDSVGNFDARFFDPQWENLQSKIMDHLEKADVVPVDVARFTPEQVAKVERFIADNQLGPRCFIVGR